MRGSLTGFACLVLAFAVAGCLRQQGPLGGQPLVPGMQLCIGVPAQTCQEQLASLGQGGLGAPVAYRITCTRQPACTLQDGEATVEALFRDGSTQGGGFGWSSAPAAP